MAKIYYPSKRVFINHSVGKMSELLSTKDISLLSGFSERITLEEKLVD